MLQNRLIVTKKSDREKINELSENKWIIELDGEKINNWDDFYDIMQKEIDIANYDKQFGKTGYTYTDFARDIILFYEVQKRKVDGITIILNYTENFKRMKVEEKEYIYSDTVFTMLLEWYRDLKIVYKREKPVIDIEMYILLEDNLVKEKSIRNEFIIGIEGDKMEIDKENIDYDTIEINSEFESYSDNLKYEEKIKRDKSVKKIEEILRDTVFPKLKIILYNADELLWYKSYALLYIIENILIERYKEGREIKIYSVFKNEIW